MNTNKKYQDSLLNDLTENLQRKESWSKYSTFKVYPNSPFFHALVKAKEGNYCIQIGPLFYSVVDYEIDTTDYRYIFKLTINPHMYDR